MDLTFPYTRYACQCNEYLNDPATALFGKGKRSSQNVEDEQEDNRLFNPHEPRANYSLYPIDELLFCDECNETRCQKCWGEEMMYYYCPSCMFEVASSGVKGDGNRCARHCYDCPVCKANLNITVLSRQPDKHLKPTDASKDNGEYILMCQYCDWSTLEIGVKFSKPTKITEQLNKLWKHRSAGTAEEESPEGKQKEEPGHLAHDAAFANLTKFYREQLSESSDQPNPYSNSPYSSPANLARIMSLYGGLSYNALKKTREKPQPMREAGNSAEGLSAFTADKVPEDDEVLRRMKKLHLDGTAAPEQRFTSPHNYEARFADELWPIATPLKVKRGKRCRTCRQILARPDNKVGSARYKIRLLAITHMPRLLLRPLQPVIPAPNPSFRLRPEPLDQSKLRPYQTQQYVLTVRNPIFDPVKVTLATPTTTPGKVSSKVTILCPTFAIGASGDKWDDALEASTISSGSDGSRRAAMASLTGSADTDRQPEAGKIWEKTRNSTSVVIEIVPGSLSRRRPSIVSDSNQSGDEEELSEDDDVLEVPIFVRVDWEHEPTEIQDSEKKARGETIHKELAYWCVLGVGRIAEQ
ncbi:hypothetical protein AC578_3620 [Pseudocercospora eumusae]|uniref:Dynactin subunit 4 n=1 Tax=Pseudocercospora eumusae TaxID=321146 RepID=A0A139HPW5_9PEZI|nr:hypothetical protein AC578_3620 [Pseudocercospora eumusae]